MKRVLLVVVLLSVALIVFAEGLSSQASFLKKHQATVYSSIREMAIEEWDSDHSMVVWEINRQCEAYTDFWSISPFDKAIAYSALIEWTDGGKVVLDRYIDNERLSEGPIDWAMVLWEYERQLNASNTY